MSAVASTGVVSAETAVADVEQQSLAAHVALCSQRYGDLNRRLSRIEAIQWKMLWANIGGFGAVLLVMLAAVLARIS